MASKPTIISCPPPPRIKQVLILRIDPPMASISLVLVLAALLLLSVSFSSASPDNELEPFPPPDGVIITESDLQALLAIKEAFQDPLNALHSWNSSYGACQGSWLGVKCAQGQVIALQLAMKQLSGSLSPQIGQLLALRKLNLHSNAIRGAIPSSLAMLPNLRGLYLNKNQFSGSIPVGLANSASLQHLDLSHNLLSGSIPSLVTSASSSSNSSSSVVSKLYFIDLSHNLLSSPLSSSSFSSLDSLLELHINHNALQGTIPSELTRQIPSLSILDLSHNQLNGSFPQALSSFSNLSFLDISYNSFAGSLPADLGNLTTLNVLNVSNNDFSSAIPAQLGNITRLQALDLSQNMLNGSIPSSLAGLNNLTYFNCSFNELKGAVPPLKHRFDASSFEGNAGLCGYDQSVACAYQAPPPRAATVASSPSSTMIMPHESPDSRDGRSSWHRFGTASFYIVVIGGIVAGILAVSLFTVLFCIFCRRHSMAAASTDHKEITGNSTMATSGKANAAYGCENEAKKSANPPTSSKGFRNDYQKEEMVDDIDGGGGKLVHFDGGLSFTAEGLLCATAEVLGKSSYGTVYKATFDDGSEVAVKRLRDGIVKSQRDFETEVNVLGKIRHSNLLSLRGYYWGPKNEKLLIFDFMPGGSLAAFLHARGPETPLTWQTRLSIAVGAAKGLEHLHEEERMVHGNLTSGNILLDARMNPRLSDFGLARLMTAAANANVIATASALGYRAPELTKLRKATTRSDVYSFGIVLLELLTGKSPADAASSGDQTAGLDLPQWVASVVKEEWTNEIFDLELMKGCAPSEDDLISTLQLAMNCVAPSPSSRPAMDEVVVRLQDMLDGNKPHAAASQEQHQSSHHTTSSDSSATVV